MNAAELHHSDPKATAYIDARIEKSLGDYAKYIPANLADDIATMCAENAGGCATEETTADEWADVFAASIEGALEYYEIYQEKRDG